VANAGTAQTTVGGERGFVRVEDGDHLRAKARQECRERASDRPRAAGDEDSPTAVVLLQLEEGRNGISLPDDLLPVERIRW
jgi:hypothetical protein